MDRLTLCIDEIFGVTYEGNYYTSGDCCAEAMREELMVPILKTAIKHNQIVVVRTNHLMRASKNYLKHAFGMLLGYGHFSFDEILKHLTFSHGGGLEESFNVFMLTEIFEPQNKLPKINYNSTLQTAISRGSYIPHDANSYYKKYLEFKHLGRGNSFVDDVIFHLQGGILNLSDGVIGYRSEKEKMKEFNAEIIDIVVTSESSLTLGDLPKDKQQGLFDISIDFDAYSKSVKPGLISSVSLGSDYVAPFRSSLNVITLIGRFIVNDIYVLLFKTPMGGTMAYDMSSMGYTHIDLMNDLTRSRKCVINEIRDNIIYFRYENGDFTIPSNLLNSLGFKEYTNSKVIESALRNTDEYFTSEAVDLYNGLGNRIDQVIAVDIQRNSRPAGFSRRQLENPRRLRTNRGRTNSRLLSGYQDPFFKLASINSMLDTDHVAYSAQDEDSSEGIKKCDVGFEDVDNTSARSLRGMTSGLIHMDDSPYQTSPEKIRNSGTYGRHANSDSQSHERDNVSNVDNSSYSGDSGGSCSGGGD